MLQAARSLQLIKKKAWPGMLLAENAYHNWTASAIGGKGALSVRSEQNV